MGINKSYGDTRYSIYNPEAKIHDEIAVGQVWRMRCENAATGGTDQPWSDNLVLGISEDGDVRLGRPYAYASCVGTTGPGILLGSEVYHVSAKRMIESYVCVGGRRKPDEPYGSFVSSGLVYLENRTRDEQISKARAEAVRTVDDLKRLILSIDDEVAADQARHMSAKASAYLKDAK